MSKILFTEEDIEILKKNKNVARVSGKSITYTFEFERLFIDEYIARKLPRDIFKENGFDIAIIGIKRVEESTDRWKKTYDKERLLINKNRELKTRDKFELIKATIEANNFKGLIRIFL
ncbi:MAG: hypothetical protein KH415_11185 [Clostridium sp.]|nr:hypothetical protein [Clostridium sp.]